MNCKQFLFLFLAGGLLISACTGSEEKSDGSGAMDTEALKVLGVSESQGEKASDKDATRQLNIEIQKPSFSESKDNVAPQAPKAAPNPLDF